MTLIVPKKVQIETGTIGAIEYFFNCFRYADDGESTTVLVDASMNIIAFFDRGTSVAQVIQNNLTYFGNNIYQCTGTYHGNIASKSFTKKKKFVGEEYSKTYFSSLMAQEDE